MSTAAIALTLRAFDPISAFLVYAEEYGLQVAVVIYAIKNDIAYIIAEDDDFAAAFDTSSHSAKTKAKR